MNRQRRGPPTSPRQGELDMEFTQLVWNGFAVFGIATMLYVVIP